MLALLEDVPGGDEADDLAVLVQQGQLLDAVLVQEGAGLLAGGLEVAMDDALARGHQGGDGAAHVLGQVYVAVGQHALEAPLGVDDDQAVDVALAHEVERAHQRGVRGDADRVVHAKALGHGMEQEWPLHAQNGFPARAQGAHWRADFIVETTLAQRRLELDS